MPACGWRLEGALHDVVVPAVTSYSINTMKAYRPITLPRTLEMVLESVIANTLAYLANVHGLLPSRDAHRRGTPCTISSNEYIKHD
jgi:hypothetical protein